MTHRDFKLLRSGWLVALMAVSLALVHSPTVAHADNGLAITSTTTYAIDAQSGVIHVVVEMGLRNTIPDEQKDGYTVQHYFSGFSLPVPAGATSPTAVDGGGSTLKITEVAVPTNPNFLLYELAFASRLRFGQTAAITLTYDIAGRPPRSDNPSRVNSAYTAFNAIGVGDAGRVTVRVVVPPDFTTDTFGEDVTVTKEEGNTVYTAANIENPSEFGFFVSARRDAALIDSIVTVDGGANFRVRSWPGDTTWQEFVTTQITLGVPVLAELIGQPWPIDEPVEVRQAYTPYLYGYAGWFSASRNELEVGENLDAEVVLHELSHAWFNNGWFADRWLSEGFAQLYSRNALAVLGGAQVDPEAIETTDPGRIPLNAWGDPDFAQPSAGLDVVEKYGYNAAFATLKLIADEIGDDRMREILDAVADDTTAYRGDGPAETFVTGTDWRRFLDLAEELGGAKLAAPWIQQHVVTPDQDPLLAKRADARALYAALVIEGEQWAPPAVVRERMSAWEFEEAIELIEASRRVLTKRDELDDRTEELGELYPDDLEALYEASNSTLAESEAAVQLQIDTADMILAAIEAESSGDGFFGTIGLLGNDLAAKLGDAKTAYANGDHERASDLAGNVIASADEASSVGIARTLFAGGGLVFVIAISVTLRLLLRRRKGQGPVVSAVD